MTRILATLALGLSLAAFAETAAAQIVVISPMTGNMVCETRRQQVADSYGWRVRDVLVCTVR